MTLYPELMHLIDMKYWEVFENHLKLTEPENRQSYLNKSNYILCRKT